MIALRIDDPTLPDVRALLQDHLLDMMATSPAESVHTLDLAALCAPEVTFWTAREDGELLACGALKRLRAGQGEIKSMRTHLAARGRGIAARLLQHITAEARERGYHSLVLETGSVDFFAPARRLYLRQGFTERGPFADYVLDPYSVFMELTLDDGPLTTSVGETPGGGGDH